MVVGGAVGDSGGGVIMILYCSVIGSPSLKTSVEIKSCTGVCRVLQLLMITNKGLEK